jgi:hypothetical protein
MTMAKPLNKGDKTSMRTGAIIYVSGDEPEQGFTKSPKEVVRDFGIEADRLEIVTRTSGHFDIHDAWRQLIVDGMQRVLCLIAEVDNNGALRLTGRQMRLCG